MKSYFTQVFVAELAHKASRTRCHVASASSSSCAEKSSALYLIPVAV